MKANNLFFVAGFLIFTGIGYCQDQSVADSLKVIYNENSVSATDLELLREISGNENHPDSILKYSDLLIEKATATFNSRMTQEGYMYRGDAFQSQANYEEALKSYYESMEYAMDLKDEGAVGKLNIAIADVYSENKNPANAAYYYKKGVEILRREKDSVSLSRALFNLGDEYIKINKLDSALIYTREAAEMFQELDASVGMVFSKGNLGRIYAKTGREDEAEKNLREAISSLREFEIYNAMAEFQLYLAELLFSKGEEKEALEIAESSLENSLEHGFKERIAEASLVLSQLYEKAGDTVASFNHFRNYIIFRDSIRNLEAVRDMATMRTNYEISQKQAEVDLLNEQKQNQRNIVVATAIASILVLMLALGLYRRNRYITKTREIIKKEKNRSDLLLLNILPEETATELKEKGRVQAKRFNAVSVLFTDFENFTHYAENLSPEELVETVDFYFSEFDEIVQTHGLEKIKTVGDSYMCAAGVPFPVQYHAVKIISAACDIIDFVNKAKELNPQNQTRFDIRIGINSGPVIAGVVGSKKFVYDIWGDSVNIASRMESTSTTGRINISENTYELVKDQFECEYRGEVNVKHKGMMKMYFVNGIKKVLKVDHSENQYHS